MSEKLIMPKKDVLVTSTMTQEIRDCISKQPSEFIIEDGHPDIRACENLLRLLKIGVVNACLPGWSRLKPVVHDDTIEFFTANVREKKPVGFNREILVFGYPEEIVTMAITIHGHFSRIIRKKDNRRNLFFQVIYYAHQILKIVVYPESIAYRVGINPSKISQCFDINPVHHCLSLPDPNYQPRDYIAQILDEHNLSTTLVDIVNIRRLLILLSDYDR
jgi:hypothetical protein